MASFGKTRFVKQQGELGAKGDSKAGVAVASLPKRSSPTAPKQEEQSRSGGGYECQLRVQTAGDDPSDRSDKEV